MSTRIRPSFSPLRSRWSSSARSRSSVAISPRSIRSCPSGVATAIKLLFLLFEERGELLRSSMASPCIPQLLFVRRHQNPVRAPVIFPAVVPQNGFHGNVLIPGQPFERCAGVAHEVPHGFFHRRQFLRFPVPDGRDFLRRDCSPEG